MAQEKKFVGLLVILAIAGLSACDPCHSLAERLCDCLAPQERHACMANVSLANQQDGKDARDPQMCIEALKENQCTCEDFNNKKYEKCGLYRRADKK